MAYRYYSVMRPVGPGTYPRPDGNTVMRIHNFARCVYVSGIRWKAWGYIDYLKPLAKKDVSNYGLVADSFVRCEDKQLICNYLLEALKLTRAQGDIEALDYDHETETVTGTYKDGCKVEINVACDSGISMLRDIMAKM